MSFKNFHQIEKEAKRKMNKFLIAVLLLVISTPALAKDVTSWTVLNIKERSRTYAKVKLPNDQMAKIPVINGFLPTIIIEDRTTGLHLNLNYKTRIEYSRFKNEPFINYSNKKETQPPEEQEKPIVDSVKESEKIQEKTNAPKRLNDEELQEIIDLLHIGKVKTDFIEKPENKDPRKIKPSKIQDTESNVFKGVPSYSDDE